MTRVRLWTGWLLAASLIVRAADTTNKCKVTSSVHGHFDLTSLRGQDFHVKGLQGQDIAVSFCGPVKTNVWAVDNPQTVGAYYEGSHGGVSLGSISDEPSLSSDGIISFKYVEGSRCPNSNARRASVIQMQCDDSWSNGKLKLVNSIDDCAYFFTMSTPHACAVSLTASVLGSLSVFVTFVLIAIAVSVVSTIAYNRLVLGKTGQDQLPSLTNIRNHFGSVKPVLTVIGIALLDVGQLMMDQINKFKRSNTYDSQNVGTTSRGTRWQPSSVDYASWWSKKDSNPSNVVDDSVTRQSLTPTDGMNDGKDSSSFSKTTMRDDEAFTIGQEDVIVQDQSDNQEGQSKRSIQDEEMLIDTIK
ncbi:hypothetical protein OIO90_004886 [Microbotryomycetes sp. JL221]|nr:hypothetical protein OIO90_004886 [Microbotryomycetes sp. JL221]